MNKVILICGKICSGKTFYAEQLRKKENAVILSCDELAFDLGLDSIKDSDFHDEMMDKASNYLYRKAVEICSCGTNVIIDFGFWSKKSRRDVSNYFSERDIPFEWHYIDISDKAWKANIEKRNRLVSEGKVRAYFLDNGLLDKLLSRFEEPLKSEMDIWLEK
jgi:predicted kinase